MARPLNKKYFGNRNVGTTATTDNKIGGEGIADVTFTNAGSWLATAGGASVPISGLSMPAPTIPGGVQATWDVTYGIESVTTGAGKAGLILNETYTSASFPGSIITVAGLAGDDAVFTVTNEGATGTLPTDLQGVNITLRTGQGHTGAGTFLVDIFTHIKGVSINESGSGYTGAETITVTTANGATGTAPSGFELVLTTDSGAAGSSTNQENAIIIYANTDDEGAKVGDIIKQVSGFTYKVKTADGTRQKCLLVADATPADGEAYIQATDSNGNTYFVTKLTSRVATVARWTQNGASAWKFANGGRAKWTFSAEPNADQVTIENA